MVELELHRLLEKVVATGALERSELQNKIILNLGSNKGSPVIPHNVENEIFAYKR